MKKAIILSIILMLILSFIFVSSTVVEEDTPTSITLLSLVAERYVVDSSNEAGDSHPSHSLGNLTDGNYTTYAKTTNNQTYYYINFTKINDSTSLTQVQIKYNTSSGEFISNYTLSDYDLCFEGTDKSIAFRLSSNYTQNKSNEVTNETLSPLRMYVSNESITLLNNSAVSFGFKHLLVVPPVFYNQSDGEQLAATNYTIDYTLGTATLSEPRWNNTQIGVNYTYTLSISLASPKVIIYDVMNQSDPYTELVASNYTIDYQTGNFTLHELTFGNATLAVNYTYHTDAIPQNSRDCYNGSAWINMGTDIGQPEIFDLRVFWYIDSLVTNMSVIYLSPDKYSIQNTSNVLFNMTIVDYVADANHTHWNCSLYNRSSRALDYSVNAAVNDWVVTNGSYFNQSLTFTDGDRIWWYIACEDEYSRQIFNTSERIFDVDLNYQTLDVYFNLNITGYNLYVGGCIKYNCSQPDGCITIGECI